MVGKIHFIGAEVVPPLIVCPPGGVATKSRTCATKSDPLPSALTTSPDKRDVQPAAIECEGLAWEICLTGARKASEWIADADTGLRCRGA